MKRIVLLVLTILLVLGMSACSETKPSIDEQACANITAGGSKVVNIGDNIYMILKDKIVKFDMDQVGENSSVDEFAFKTGEYTDICLFNGKIYAIETVSENQNEIVTFEPDSGDEKIIKAYKGSESIYFKTIIGDKLYIYVDGSVYSLDSNDEIKDTGFRDTLFITEDGAYTSKSVVDNTEKGLCFIPNNKTESSVVEYPELKENNVQIKFKYGKRIYLTVDGKPAYIEHNGDTSVTYINGASTLPDLDKAIYVGLNYIDSPDKTLIYAVGLYNSTENASGTYNSNGEFYSNIYSVDVESGKATLLYTKTHLLVPLCFPSVIGNDVFAGGIGDSTDWITFEDHA